MNNSDLTYVFLCSNVPVPRTFQFASFLKSKGLKHLTLFLNRNNDLVSYLNTSTMFGFDAKIKSISFRRVLAILRFYNFVRKIIIVNSSCKRFVFHSDSIDLYLISLFLKWEFKGKLVLEIRDLHKIQLSWFGMIFMKPFESFIYRFLEILIITSPEYYNVYYKSVFSKNVHLIENIPDINIQKIDYSKRDIVRLTIGYVGVVRYPNQILNIINTVKYLNAQGMMVNLKIWGGIAPEIKTIILDEISNVDQIEYFGPYNYKDIYYIFSCFDILYSVYDTRYKNVLVAIPNKYYECILFKKPIIVASETYLCSLVYKNNIGICVDSESQIDLLNVISQIFNKDENWYLKTKQNLASMKSSNLKAEFDISMNKFYEALNNI